MSLASCLKKIGLSKHEAAILRGEVKNYRDEGYPAHEAAVRAVKGYIKDLEDERTDILRQTGEGGTITPPTEQKPVESQQTNPIAEQTTKAVEAMTEAVKALSAEVQSIKENANAVRVEKAAQSNGSVQQATGTKEGQWKMPANESGQRIPESGQGKEAQKVVSAKKSTGKTDEPPLSLAQEKTKTPEFIKWFGNSKVVDDNGDPLVVYHGTATPGFTEFNSSKIGKLATSEGKGFYFTNVEKRANGYAGKKGQTYKVYLNISNPITDLKQKTISRHNLKQIFNALLKVDPEALSNYGDIEYEGKAAVLNTALETEGDNESDLDLIGSLINGGTSSYSEVMDAIKQVTGFDGVILDWGNTPGEKVYVAFRPEQIKGATNNRGTFDPNNPDILFSRTKTDLGATLSTHGIDANLKEKATALEAAGQFAGKFKITSGKLLNSVLEGTTGQTREDLQAVKVLQDLFGAPVALLTSDGPFKFNGVYYHNLIWLDANSPVSLPLVFGHELSHRMEDDNPTAYNALLRSVMPMMRNMDAYKAKNRLEGLSDIYIAKEILGDILGDRFGEPAFWNQVAANTSRSEFHQIITAIRLWIDRVIAKMRGLGKSNGIGSSQFVNDLEAVRKIMAKAVADYATTRKTGEKQGKPQFSRNHEQKQPFYSSLERAIESAKQSSMPAKQWALWLKANYAKLGVKLDEIDAVGMNEWFNLQNGSLTKEQVLDFVRQNRVQIKDIIKGDDLSGSEQKRLEKLGKIGYENLDNSEQEEFDALNERALDHEGSNKETKFSQWQLPGGKNYKEIFMTLPNVKGYSWNDGHSQYNDIVNPLVRLRMNERFYSNGKRMLFIEELQGPSKENEAKMPSWSNVKNRTLQAVKWAIRYAAENGFGRIAWTTGENQADRYDLSKHADSVHYDPYNKQLSVRNGNQQILKEQDVEPEKIADHIGKEVAKKLLGSKLNGAGNYELKGIDLKVGGEGIRTFYDKMLPQMVNRYVNKWGVKVGETTIETPGYLGKWSYEGPLLTWQEVRDKAEKELDATLGLQAQEIYRSMRDGRLSFQDAMEKYGSYALAESFGGKLVDLKSSVHSVDYRFYER